jgi:hypothetical protein
LKVALNTHKYNLDMHNNVLTISIGLPFINPKPPLWCND